MGGIDILVKNADIFNMAKIDMVTLEDYRRQYDVNVGGTILTIQVAFSMMKKRGGGVIVNFASQAGRWGEPNIVLYCSITAAVISITQSLALELAVDNIRVDAIASGVIDTPIWNAVDARFSEYEKKEPGQKKNEVVTVVPPGRIGDSEDTTDPCVFLASNESRCITAQTLNVNGGKRMS